MKIYCGICDWYPHNTDSGCDCDLFSDLDVAKKYLEEEVKSYIEEMTKVNEDGYQYCEGMEYVNWNEDKTACSLCTEREDYVNWRIEEKEVKEE